MASKVHVLRLYRRSLKLSLDWCVHRYLWRGQAMYLRSLFEANRNITEPRQQREVIKETEALLEKWKHPDPYRPPTAPGGSKYERNMPIQKLRAYGEDGMPLKATEAETSKPYKEINLPEDGPPHSPAAPSEPIEGKFAEDK